MFRAVMLTAMIVVYTALTGVLGSLAIDYEVIGSGLHPWVAIPLAMVCFTVAIVLLMQLSDHVDHMDSLERV